jgi:hypothetical protein
MFKLIIKFVTRYDEDVDKVMAEAEFASKLLYYGKINVMEGMVVMEYVDGMTAYSSSQLPPRFCIL